MKPLIDGDILRYEVGFMAHIKDEAGEPALLDFDRVVELLHKRIDLICAEVDATVSPTIYLTEDSIIRKQINRERRLNDLPELEEEKNFREAVAVTKPYKGTRKAEKPFHFANLTVYLLENFDCHISRGVEADDSMGLEQYMCWNCQVGPEPTIICSRDKDLRMIPGWHYSWECGKQPSIGPVETNFIGWLEKKPDGKVIGYGIKFFYYQMLVGDTVDNIPGAPGVGPVKAFNLLDPLTDDRVMYEAVRELYKEVVGEGWKEYLQEQANLLWIVREWDYESCKPIFFQPPENVK